MKPKKKTKQPHTHHAWAVFKNGVPNFMSATPVEATDPKQRALVILEQFRIMFPSAKLSVGKVTIVRGWV